MKASKLKEFKREIIELCKEYDISISHEDGHGGFIFENYSDRLADWFNYGDWFNEDDLDKER